MWIKIILMGIPALFLLPFIIVLLWDFIAFIYAAAFKLHYFLQDKIDIFLLDENLELEKEKELTVDVSKLPISKSQLVNQYLPKVDTSLLNTKVTGKCPNCGEEIYFDPSSDINYLNCPYCKERFDSTKVNKTYHLIF